MIVVSCRKNFDSTHLFSDKHLYRNYPNPSNPAAFTDLTYNDVIAAATNKHIALLVHGYNNTMENVLKAYWELASGMKNAGVSGAGGYGLVIGFAWPGYQTKPGYFAARATAKKSGPFLRDLVNALRTVALSVDVETHSLGARVALTALRKPNQVFVDNLVLTAPAVDNNILEPGEDFFSSLDKCNRCFVYHSKHDPVLKGAFPLGDILDGIHKALGLNGPRSRKITLDKCPNTYVVDCAARVTSHGGYRNAPQFYEHWTRVLSGSPMNRYDELS